jgi:hypothetical protein
MRERKHPGLSPGPFRWWRRMVGHQPHRSGPRLLLFHLLGAGEQCASGRLLLVSSPGGRPASQRPRGFGGEARRARAQRCPGRERAHPDLWRPVKCFPWRWTLAVVYDPIASVVASFAIALCFVLHIEHFSGMVNERGLPRLHACRQRRKRALVASYSRRHAVCIGVSLVGPGRSSIVPPMEPACR